MIDLPCVQKNWIFPLKDVRLKTPLDNNQTGPSGRLIVVEGVLRRTSYNWEVASPDLTKSLVQGLYGGLLGTITTHSLSQQTQ